MEIISRPKEVPLITYGSVSKSVAVSWFLKTGVLPGAKLLGYYFGKRTRERDIVQLVVTSLFVVAAVVYLVLV